MWIFKLALVFLVFEEVAGECEPGGWMAKNHTWNTGYIGKLFLDQSWLLGQTTDWRLNISFCQEILEFKIWSADIVNPPTRKRYVKKVQSVEITNKCWNPFIYPCQMLQLPFMVRFSDWINGTLTTKYDIFSVTEYVTYKGGSSDTHTYCPLTDSDICIINASNTKMPTTNTKPAPTSPSSTEATFIKVIRNIIDENGEIYEQVDSYNNGTGEVSIVVPPHGDMEALQVMLDPVGDTLVTSSSSKCQIKSIPDGVDPYSFASSGDEVGSRDEAITEDTEEVNHSITIEITEATPEDLEKLSPALYSACGDKKVVLTEEKDVTAGVFETLTSGGIIDFGPGNHRSKRDRGNCSISRMCGARTSGCWRWPYGTSFSIHHLNLDVLCVECCQDEGSTSELCTCSSITSLEQLEQCTKPVDGSCPEGFYSCDGQCKVEVGAPSGKCNGSCPESRVPCGDLCIPSEWSSSLYDHYKQWVDCNGQCVRGNAPCNGICPVGKTACGDRCVENNYVDRWYTVCDGACITKNMPCNGICEDGKILCGEVCKQDDGNWRMCNGTCIHKTESCSGICPGDRYLCGNSSRCNTPDDKSFKVCNGDCIPYLTPCDNICPNDTVSCGDECVKEATSWKFRECNGKCIYFTKPCNGECPYRMIFCQHNQNYEYSYYYDNYYYMESYEYFEHYGSEDYCKPEDGSTHYCGGFCFPKSQACNGTCSEGWVACHKKQNDWNPDCIENVSNASTFKVCNGTCIPKHDVCDGECQDGFHRCDDSCYENIHQCNNQCPEGWEQCGEYNCMDEDYHGRTHQSCGGQCISKYGACNDSCPEGMEACGDWDALPYYSQKLCYNSESLNRPCNGTCLKNGDICDGQCPDGFAICTLGYIGYKEDQVCYKDSEESLVYIYNGYCWYKNYHQAIEQLQ